MQFTSLYPLFSQLSHLLAVNALSLPTPGYPASLFFTDVYYLIAFLYLHCRAPELTHQVNKSLPRKRTETGVF